MKKIAPAPPVVRSPYGIEKIRRRRASRRNLARVRALRRRAAKAVGTGEGGGGRIGTDTVGARAIYAPTPVIPDDLREDVIQTEAVAHFDVRSTAPAS